MTKQQTLGQAAQCCWLQTHCRIGKYFLWQAPSLWLFVWMEPEAELKIAHECTEFINLPKYVGLNYLFPYVDKTRFQIHSWNPEWLHLTGNKLGYKIPFEAHLKKMTLCTLTKKTKEPSNPNIWYTIRKQCQNDTLWHKYINFVTLFVLHIQLLLQRS